MTVSTTNTFEFDISGIALLAYRKAGLVSLYTALTDPQAKYAMDELDLVVRSTHTDGLFAKVMRFEQVTLVAGTSNYTLPTYVLDLDGDGAFVPVGQPTSGGAVGETPVRPISREKWQALSNQGASGRPVEYFTDRTGSAIVVYVWPIPDAGNAGTIRFQAHRLRANAREGQATLEFEPYWQEYFVTALASRLAMSHSLGLGRVKMLRDEAEELLKRCNAQSQQRGAQQFSVAHRSGQARGAHR